MVSYPDRRGTDYLSGPRIYVFADESGNFDFSRNKGASKYFILTTVTITTFTAGLALQELRSELAWEGVGLSDAFHATTDKQELRDKVFETLQHHSFRVDATMFEKSKAMPHVRSSDARFYQTAWYQHMKYLAPRIAPTVRQIMVVSAAIGTKKKGQAFHGGIEEVMQQLTPKHDYRVAFWPASSHPCLQLADYCAWAIQRKWEGGDSRSHVLIAPKIASEFDVFRHSQKHYY